MDAVLTLEPSAPPASQACGESAEQAHALQLPQLPTERLPTSAAPHATTADAPQPRPPQASTAAASADPPRPSPPTRPPLPPLPPPQAVLEKARRAKALLASGSSDPSKESSSSSSSSSSAAAPLVISVSPSPEKEAGAVGDLSQSSAPQRAPAEPSSSSVTPQQQDSDEPILTSISPRRSSRQARVKDSPSSASAPEIKESHGAGEKGDSAAAVESTSKDTKKRKSKETNGADAAAAKLKPTTQPPVAAASTAATATPATANHAPALPKPSSPSPSPPSQPQRPKGPISDFFLPAAEKKKRREEENRRKAEAAAASAASSSTTAPVEPSTLVTLDAEDSCSAAQPPPGPEPRALRKANIFMTKEEKRAMKEKELAEAEARKKEEVEKKAVEGLRAKIQEAKQWDTAVRTELGKEKLDLATLSSQMSQNLASAARGCDLSLLGTFAPLPTREQCHVRQHVAAPPSSVVVISDEPLLAGLVHFRTVKVLQSLFASPWSPRDRTILMPSSLSLPPSQRSHPEVIDVDAASHGVVVVLDDADTSSSSAAAPHCTSFDSVAWGSVARAQTARKLYDEHYRLCRETVDPLQAADVWAEKYRPHKSGHVLGNKKSVARLHKWLTDWKVKMNARKQKAVKPKKAAPPKKKSSAYSDSDDDYFAMLDGFDSDDSAAGEDKLLNTLLITGPPGSGKTAAIHACAEELGYKVLEINSSSHRSGRHIMTMFQEATQSHQVSSKANPEVSETAPQPTGPPAKQASSAAEKAKFVAMFQKKTAPASGKDAKEKPKGVKDTKDAKDSKVAGKDASSSKEEAAKGAAKVDMKKSNAPKHAKKDEKVVEQPHQQQQAKQPALLSDDDFVAEAQPPPKKKRGRPPKNAGKAPAAPAAVQDGGKTKAVEARNDSGGEDEFVATPVSSAPASQGSRRSSRRRSSQSVIDATPPDDLLEAGDAPLSVSLKRKDAESDVAKVEQGEEGEQPQRQQAQRQQEPEEPDQKSGGHKAKKAKVAGSSRAAAIEVTSPTPADMSDPGVVVVQEKKTSTGASLRKSLSATKRKATTRDGGMVSGESDSDFEVCTVVPKLARGASAPQVPSVRSSSPPTIDLSQPSTSVGLAEASVIVIEDVDILFDDDKGFWQAITALARSTKRPIIFTSNNSRAQQDVPIPIMTVEFKRPVLDTALMHAQLLCVAEAVPFCSVDLQRLVGHIGGDLRKISMTLQALSSRHSGRMFERSLGIHAFVDTALPFHEGISSLFPTSGAYTSMTQRVGLLELAGELGHDLGEQVLRLQEEPFAAQGGKGKDLSAEETARQIAELDALCAAREDLSFDDVFVKGGSRMSEQFSHGRDFGMHLDWSEMSASIHALTLQAHFERTSSETQRFQTLLAQERRPKPRPPRQDSTGLPKIEGGRLTGVSDPSALPLLAADSAAFQAASSTAATPGTTPSEALVDALLVGDVDVEFEVGGDGDGDVVLPPAPSSQEEAAQPVMDSQGSSKTEAALKHVEGEEDEGEEDEEEEEEELEDAGASGPGSSLAVLFPRFTLRDVCEENHDTLIDAAAELLPLRVMNTETSLFFTDYLRTLSCICKVEKLKRALKTGRRAPIHHLRNASLGNLRVFEDEFESPEHLSKYPKETTPPPCVCRQCMARAVAFT